MEVRRHGEPVPLPPGLDLSAYRIIQEGLTNTLKHAQAKHAQVDVHYDPADLRLEVRDDGGTRTSTSTQHQNQQINGAGHGLVGIGERVKIYGGEMTAGAGRTGGFLLRVRLPLDDGGDA